MKIVIHGKNIEVTRALEDAINKKLSKLDNYFSQELEAHVTLSVEKNNQIIEVGILFIAIDLVVDKLYKQIRRQKTKLVKKYSNKDIRSLDILLDNIENDDLEDDIIIKVKKFPIKPMYKDEAILQMELIGHDFYVFINAETNDVNVLYRRKSGNYGLIEAEY